MTLMERAQIGVLRAGRARGGQEVSAGEMGDQGPLGQQATVPTVAELEVHDPKVIVPMAIGLSGLTEKVVQPGNQRHRPTVPTEIDHVLLVTAHTAAVAELEGLVHKATVPTEIDHVLLVTVPPVIAEEALAIEVAHRGSREKVEIVHTSVDQVGTHGYKMHRRRTCRKAGGGLREEVLSRLG